MFKHLLLPTDGSPLSDIATEKGIALARSVGAKVTGVHVMPEYHPLSYRIDTLQSSQHDFKMDGQSHAATYLNKMAQAAIEARVPCDTVAVMGDHAYEKIIAEAVKRDCDLIVMASHGRKGIQALLLGSETHKVLTHTKIPVLVFHSD